MGRIIEGVWDCQYCEQKKIPGSVRDCPSCGRPRDNSVRFYIDNPQNYIPDEKAPEISKNPDWLCAYCDSLNPDKETVCIGCGMARDESSKTYFENHTERANEKNRDVEFTFDDKPESYDTLGFEERERVTPETTKSRRHINWKRIISIAALVAVMIGLIAGGIVLFSPREVSGTVESFEWERSIEIQEYKTVVKENWSVEPGGRIISQREEIQTYREVIDHYETETYTEEVVDHYETVVTGYKDLGNGYFEEITEQRPVYRTETRTRKVPVYRQEPVYATKYTYEIEEWVRVGFKKSSGDDQKPYWAECNLTDKQRKGPTTEVYKVYIVEGNQPNAKPQMFELSYDEWVSISVGDHVTIKYNLAGSAELIAKE